MRGVRVCMRKKKEKSKIEERKRRIAYRRCVGLRLDSIEYWNAYLK